MICLICREAETVEGQTSVNFERGETRVSVNHVPVYTCPFCGEAYVDENVAVGLLQRAEEMSAIGIMDSVMEYQEAGSWIMK